MGRSISPNSLRQRLFNLNVGEQIEIGMQEYKPSNIRSQASMLTCDFGMKFKVEAKRDDRITIISRLS